MMGEADRRQPKSGGQKRRRREDAAPCAQFFHAVQRVRTNQSAAQAAVSDAPPPARFTAGRPPGRLRSAYSLSSEVLGRGQFGEVRSCRCRASGRVYACKSVLKGTLQTGIQTEGLQTEVALTGVLAAHPNIVAAIDVFEDDSHVHLIMERCVGGDLFTLIESITRVPEAVSALIFRKIVLAVDYCHSKGVLHRDIKPENILLQVDSSGAVEPKLADFGLSTIVKPGGVATGFAGSVYYVAPEVIINQTHSTASDVWSLGVVLYVMLSGFVPFWGKTSIDTFAAICSKPVNTTSGPWSSISDSAKDLLQKMLSQNPEDRPSLMDVLTHDWLMSSFGTINAESDSASTVEMGDPSPRIGSFSDEVTRLSLEDQQNQNGANFTAKYEKGYSQEASSLVPRPPTPPLGLVQTQSKDSAYHVMPRVLVPRPPSVPRAFACSPRASTRLRLSTQTMTSGNLELGNSQVFSSPCSPSAESGLTFDEFSRPV